MSDKDSDTRDIEESKVKPSLEEHANFFSRTLFMWLTPILKLGKKRPLTFEDLPSLSTSDTADVIYTNTKKTFDKTIKDGKPSIIKAMYKSFGKPFLIAAFIKLVHDIMQFLQPVFLNNLLNFLDDQEADISVGIGFALALFITSVIQSYCIRNYFFLCFRTGMRMRSTVVTMVYNKALKISSSSKSKYTTGEITNLMEVDSQRFQDLTSYLQTLWSGPFQIILALSLLLNYMGWPAFAGVIVILIMIPVSKTISKKLKTIQKEIMAAKDVRIQTTSEVINGMKIIKLQAWEKAFLEKLTGIRNEEVKVLRKYAIWSTINTPVWNVIPVLVAVITFATYTLTGNTLDYSIAFTALSLFDLLRFPLTMFPQTINTVAEAQVSINRVENFLLCEEYDRQHIHADSEQKGITLKNCSFKWAINKDEPTSEDVFKLSDISLHIPMNQLVGITGPVGCGKSSLINAILGEMPRTNGEMFVGGKICYVPQISYIMNDTLMNNILFGKPYNKELYDKVIDVCALKPDIRILPAGDQTEIGEKGINLSGGQKVRVSLARAVYQNSDIYILDDPLSAVDSHVSKYIFNKCIKEILKEKCVILITHALEYLEFCDDIFVLNKGHIEEHGSWNELINSEENRSVDPSKHSLLYTLYQAQLASHKETTKSQEELSPSLTPTSPSVDKPIVLTAEPLPGPAQPGVPEPVPVPLPIPTKTEPVVTTKEEETKRDRTSSKSTTHKGELIKQETRETGSVDKRIYLEYGRAAGGVGWLLLVVFFYICSEVCKASSSYWITIWSNDNLSQENTFYLIIYFSIGIVYVIFLGIRAFSVFIVGLKASKKLHNKLLMNVLHLPMSFFDTTPQGRIINRFSKDVYTVDKQLPDTCASFLNSLMNVLSTCIIISIATPWFLVVLIFIAAYYIYEEQFFINSSREIKRLDSISRSPIYAHFSETLDGIPVIRAYQMEPYFIHNNYFKLDHNQQAYFLQCSANCWLGLRLEFAGSLIIIASTMLAVIGKSSGDENFAALAALSITYALNVTQTLNWLVRMATDMETQIVAVERINEYANLPQEAPYLIKETEPAPEWPDHGEITIDHMSMKYRPELEPVLHDLTLDIHSNEKIGVVGRTGAGKSSLMLALMRIIELYKGRILIDGVDVSKIGLYTLRSNIAIISQESILFSGTIRYNIDPFNEYEDCDIWAALERAHLKDYVKSLSEELDSIVEEHGNNYSVGQRQLLCIARALLHRSKIILMDEATASIDVDTDLKIQKTIRSEFKDSTVITIAHRIHTIIDSDRVMVLDKGELKEFDTPRRLLEDPNSMFYSLVNKWKADGNQA